jgi:cell division protein FtsN
MRQESGGRVSATSRVGASGLMQVMPSTYAGLRARHGFGNDPYHPYDNIMAGTAYIREMYELYGSPAFLAAYNAGPRRLEEYLYAGRGLPEETRHYVSRIGPAIAGHHPRRQAPPEVIAAAEIQLPVPPGPRRGILGTNPTALATAKEERARIYGAEGGGGYAIASAQQISVAHPATPRFTAVPPSTTSSYSGNSSTTVLGSQGQAPRPWTTPASASLQPPVAIAEPPRSGWAPSGLFLGAAHASTLPRPVPVAHRLAPVAVADAARGGWSIQVGAYSQEGTAHVAAEAAREHLRLSGASPIIQPTSVGSTLLWRARLGGLTREAAEDACNRYHSAECLIVPPAG